MLTYWTRNCKPALRGADEEMRNTGLKLKLCACRNQDFQRGPDSDLFPDLMGEVVVHYLSKQGTEKNGGGM